MLEFFSVTTTQGLNLPNVTADSLISNAITVFLVIIGIVAVISIIISAIMMISSGGNSEKVATARRNLLWSIVGLVVALFASVIVGLIVGVIK